jgi:hypothetical protein
MTRNETKHYFTPYKKGFYGCYFLFLDEKMVKSIPTTILNSWESSPGHNANLLSKDVTKVGIAISSVVYMKNGFLFF